MSPFLCLSIQSSHSPPTLPLFFPTRHLPPSSFFLFLYLTIELAHLLSTVCAIQKKHAASYAGMCSFARVHSLTTSLSCLFLRNQLSCRKWVARLTNRGRKTSVWFNRRILINKDGLLKPKDSIVSLVFFLWCVTERLGPSSCLELSSACA